MVNTNSQIYMNFSALVEPSSLPAAISFNPAVSFSLEFYNNIQLTIIPDSLLMADTLYTVTVDTTIRDLWGGTMSASFVSTFRTE